MLGFSGHFSTKSRTYSTTLGALRDDRARHQREYAIAAGLWPDPGGDTILVLAHWSFTGADSRLSACVRQQLAAPAVPNNRICRREVMSGGHNAAHV